jgi:quercetin dioxygenase-like cupin family protein
MKHVEDTQTSGWVPFEAATLMGYSLKPEVIGADYTDAYSADLVRIEPGGSSATHVDAARHAFYILEGEGSFTLAGETHAMRPGVILKVPPGVAHALRNDGTRPLVMLALYDPPRRRRKE